jgi:hypothetical protein
MRLNRVEPSVINYGLGRGVGCFSVVPGESVTMNIWCSDCGDERNITIDPDLAPILRSIAFRLDEIAKRKREAK